jgi:hypothetical protein
MPEREEDPRVDDLRERLRSLGYLDTRLSRFFLADLERGAGFLYANFKNSLKLGIAGGVLVALLLTLGTLEAAPEMAREPLDLAVLGGYFTLAAALFIAGLEFSAGLVLRGLSRAGFAPRIRPVPVARAIALGFGVACLLYLTFWWRSNALPAAASTPISLAVLSLCLLAALAMGRFAFLATLGVLARIAPAPTLTRPGLSRLRLLPLAAAGGLVYAGLFLLLTRAPTTAEEAPASPYRVDASSYRVMVIGIDGLSLEMLRELSARGKAPGFETLGRKAASAPLEPIADRVPSLVWTSIATGQRPSAHGIRAMQAERMPGLRMPLQVPRAGGGLGRALASMGAAFRLTEPRPVSKALARAKAVWDILADQGKSVGVVGWWASWPADEVSGFILSDRLFFKLESGGRYEQEVDGPELFTRLAAGFASDREQAVAALGGLAEEARRAGGPEVATAMERDSYHLLVGDRLRREQNPDLYLVYLSALDVAAMKLLAGAPADLVQLSRSVGLIERYLDFLGSTLARLVSELGQNDVLVVVAEPGRLARAAAARGVVFLAGAAAAGGGSKLESSPASEYDIAPTLLYLLGFPRSAEMAGVVRQELLAAELLESRPPQLIPTFGRRRALRQWREAEFDAEMYERLRSLGYVQ